MPRAVKKMVSESLRGYEINAFRKIRGTITETTGKILGAKCFAQTSSKTEATPKINDALFENVREKK